MHPLAPASSLCRLLSACQNLPQTAAARRHRALSCQHGRTLRCALSQPRQPATAFAFNLLAGAKQGRPKLREPLAPNRPEVCRAAVSLWARRSGLGDRLARQRGAGRHVQQAQQECTPAPCSLKR